MDPEEERKEEERILKKEREDEERIDKETKKKALGKLKEYKRRDPKK